MEYENMELEGLVFDKVSKEFEAQKRANDSFVFHNHAPKMLIGFIEGTRSGPFFQCVFTYLRVGEHFEAF